MSRQALSPVNVISCGDPCVKGVAAAGTAFGSDPTHTDPTEQTVVLSKGLTSTAHGVPYGQPFRLAGGTGVRWGKVTFAPRVVTDANSIDVTPDELNQAVMREAMRYPGQERQVLEFYGKNAELKEQLRAPIFEEKTVDFILELAKVNEKSVTPEELLKAAREAEDEDDKPADSSAPAAN